MYDLLVSGGLVYDGTGADPVRADVAVAGGRIAAIGDLAGAETKVTLDAGDRAVTPGFIDMHSHADCSAPMWPDMESLLGQGVTTCFAGHCGFGLAPISNGWLEMKFDQAAINRFLPEFMGGPIPDPQRVVDRGALAPVFREVYGEELDWTDYAGYMAHLDRVGIGCNLSAQVGQHQLRQEAMGGGINRPATEEEIKTMETLLSDALAAGAWGFSIGLDYRPGTYADSAELRRLMAVTARHDGVVTAHVQLRPNRGDQVCQGHTAIDGYREFLELGLETGARLHISHLINGCNPAEDDAVTAENAQKTLDLINSYRRRGGAVTWDTLPPSTIAMFHFPQLINYLRPYLDRCGGIAAFQQALRETNFGQLIAGEIRAGHHASQSVFSRIDPIQNPAWADKLTVLSTTVSEAAGKTLAELAQERGCDAVEVLLQMAADDPYARCGKGRRFDPVSFRVFEASGEVCYGTDNGCCNYGTIYREGPDLPFYVSTPSAFCGMIRCLEETTLPFAKCIHGLTGRAAEAAGYRDRGILAPGMAADLLVLDRQNLRSNFSEVEPQTMPSGLDYVVVNGQVAVDHGKFLHPRSGRTLRREGL